MNEEKPEIPEQDPPEKPEVDRGARRMAETGTRHGERPEPPLSWRPSEQAPDAADEPVDDNRQCIQGKIGSTVFELNQDEVPRFQAASRFLLIAQIASIASLFIFGVMLSAFAIVCAFIGYIQMKGFAEARGGDSEVQSAAKRAGLAVIGLAAFALVLNIITAMYLYPMLMDVMQSSFTGNFAASSAVSTGSSTWG